MERLAYFGSAEGRDDLHEYNRREGEREGGAAGRDDRCWGAGHQGRAAMEGAEQRCTQGGAALRLVSGCVAARKPVLAAARTVQHGTCTQDCQQACRTCELVHSAAPAIEGLRPHLPALQAAPCSRCWQTSSRRASRWSGCCRCGWAGRIPRTACHRPPCRRTSVLWRCKPSCPTTSQRTTPGGTSPLHRPVALVCPPRPGPVDPLPCPSRQ